MVIRIHNKVSGYVLLFSILLIISGCTHPFGEQMDNTPLGNFRALWTIIDEKYCYIDEKGINWDSVYSVYYPQFDTIRVTKDEDNRAVFYLMEKMISLLKDGHVNLYSPFDTSSMYNSLLEGYPENFDFGILTQYYLTQKNYQQANGLNYCKIDGDSIGYVYYSSFLNSFSLTDWLSVLDYFSDCKGIVLDVRNNTGGYIENAYKLASPFFTRDTVVGYWQHKSGSKHQDFSDLKAMYITHSQGWWKRPVVVLCNRHIFSAANFFVSIMRYADNCLILGGKSCGGGGIPMSYELPNGWLFRFSSVRIFDRDLQSLENGVTPQVIVNQQSTDKDDLIEKAIELIHSAYK